MDTATAHTNKVLIDQANAISSLVDTDIVPRFSTNDLYSDKEQSTINKALKILASKLVGQEPENLLTSSQAAQDFLQLKLATSDREIFAVIFLSNANRVIAYQEMSIGTLDSASVSPREIVKLALKHNAKHLILSHNHPSGGLVPSGADLRITETIARAANLFDIQVLDHIIVSIEGTISFKASGLAILGIL